MRLLRFTFESESDRGILTDLMGARALDLVQLDFRADAPLAQPDALLQVLPSIHKHFYLSEQLSLVTNAGACSEIEATEALARYLREHDDPRVPISAIRGANILPRLADYIADGLALCDLHSGEDLANLVHSIRSAQVELGAGPIATALADGSRMVVAGCYDMAAPFIAAAVVGHAVDWNDAEVLAKVTAASLLSGENVATAEISDELSVHLECAASASTAIANLQCADVDCDLTGLRLVPNEFQSSRIEGVSGALPSGNWRVRLVLHDEAGAESIRWSSIPREAVNVSVDTRYAAEWI